jgi:hypothetical protein
VGRTNFVDLEESGQLRTEIIDTTATYSEVLERPGILDVSKSRLEVLELDVNLLLRLLRPCNLPIPSAYSL